MNAPSLTGFLSITGARFRLFDLGTQVRKLPEQALSDLDSGKPYPWPHLGFGWLVLFLWNPERKEQNSFWFLKLPLDELGIVSAAVHGDLVNRLYRSLQQTDARERQRLLTDHPYQFQPDAEKMAALHARATRQLGLPPSPYFESADRFYRQGAELDWRELGIQGMADLICRAHETDYAAINKRLKVLAAEPASHLIRQFEHVAVPTATVETLLALVQANPKNELLVNACLRGASQANAKRLFDDFITRGTEADQLSLETLLLVLTRYTHLLDDVALATRLLDQLARRADADGFHRVLTNLAMQPGMNDIVRSVLSSPTLTEPLANALSQLIQQSRHTHEQH